MRRMVTVVTLTVIACLAMAPVVRGQDAPPAPRRGPGGPGGFNPADTLKTQVAKVDLTDDQKTKVEAIFKKAADDQKAARDANQDKVADLRKQMQAARDANDNAKVTQLRQDMLKLFTGAVDNKKVEASVKELLTPEQKTKLEKIQLDASLARARDLGSLALLNADKLPLTDDQKTKITALVKANEDAVGKLARGPDTMKQRQELGAKLDTDVKALLTPEQLKKLDQLQFDARIARGRDLGSQALANAEKITLTDDQKTKVTALVKAYLDARGKIAPDAADARTQMTTLSDKLKADVTALLTDAQKTALDKIQADNPRRGGRGGANGAGAGAGGGRRGGNNAGGAPPAGGAAPAPAPVPPAGGDRI